jgi:hypothetical protein
MTVEAVLSSNPVLDAERERRRGLVKRRFCEWMNGEEHPDWQLALYPFSATRPLRYLLDSELSGLIDFFSTDINATLQSLENHGLGITHAVDTVMTRSASWQHEDPIELRAAEDYAAFEQVWHPEYQRYAEHAFNHLIKIPLELLGRSARKDYVSQALALRVERLRAEAVFTAVTAGFQSTVRNSIAHGSATFTQFGVQYSDTKSRIELYPDARLQGTSTLWSSQCTR